MAEDATFQKVTRSNQRLYGPRKLLLCGFEAEAQPKFMKLLELLEIPDLPTVWATEDQAGLRLADLLELPDRTGWGISSKLTRTIVMSGVTQNELHLLMSGCKQAGMKQALWATLTPVTEGWALERLITELIAEREAMEKRKR